MARNAYPLRINVPIQRTLLRLVDKLIHPLLSAQATDHQTKRRLPPAEPRHCHLTPRLAELLVIFSIPIRPF